MTMNTLIAALGLLIVVVAAGLCLRPQVIFRLTGRILRSAVAIYAAIGLRVVFGVILVLGAGETRFPGAIQVIGALTIAAALIVAAVGRSRLAAFVAWWVDRPLVVLRLAAFAALVLGAFIAYAALSVRL